ncbi:MAG: DUF2306 domain-containing protein [Bacteroidota bacterium]
MYKKLTLGFFLIGAMSMLVMSWHYLSQPSSGILVGKAVAQYDWYQFIFRTHVLFGLIAISIGPFQLSNALRRRNLRLHRSLGYLYTLGVGLSSLTGLGVAPHAMGGWISGIGFSILAVLWFSTLVLGITSARKGDITRHHMWMYLNYGLTFAAITQRTMLLLAFLPSLPFISVYKASAWLPWMINGAIAYTIFLRTHKKAIA